MRHFVKHLASDSKEEEAKGMMFVWLWNCHGLFNFSMEKKSGYARKLQYRALPCSVLPLRLEFSMLPILPMFICNSSPQLATVEQFVWELSSIFVVTILVGENYEKARATMESSFFLCSTKSPKLVHPKAWLGQNLFRNGQLIVHWSKYLQINLLILYM